MADFTTEEMRQLLQRLAAELAQTKGDASIVAQLRAVEKAIKKLEERENSRERFSRQESRRMNTELLEGLSKELEKVRKTIEDNNDDAGPGAGQGKLNSIINPKQTRDFGSAIASMTKFGKYASNILNGTVKTAIGLSNLDGSMVGFAEALGVTSVAAREVLKAMDNNINAYRTIVNTSEGTIKGIMHLRETAAKASLSVDEFAQAIAKGTQGTRLLGAQPWAELYTSLKQSTKNANYYGMNTQQMIHSTNEYLGMLAEQGSLLSKSPEELKRGLAAIVEGTDKTAYILGKTREEQLQAMKDANRDPNFNLFRTTLRHNADQSAALSEALTIAASFGPEVKTILQELVQFESIRSTDAAIQFTKMDPNSQKLIEQLAFRAREGTISVNEVVQMGSDVAASLRSLDAGTREYYAAQGATLGELHQSFADTLVKAYSVRDLKDRQATPEKTDTFTSSLLQVEQGLKDFSAGLSEVTNKLLGSFSDTWGGTLQNIAGYTGSWLKTIKDVILGFENLGTVVSITAGLLAAGSVASSVTGLAATALKAGLGPILSGFAKAIVAPIKLLSSGIGKLSSFLTSGAAGSVLDAALSKNDANNKTKGKGRGFIKGAASVALGYVALEAVNTLNPMTDEDRHSDFNKSIQDSSWASWIPGLQLAADAGDKIGSTLADYLITNHPETAAWINKNVYGNETDEKTVQALRKAIDETNAEASGEQKQETVVAEPVNADIAEANQVVDLSGEEAIVDAIKMTASTDSANVTPVSLVEDSQFSLANDDLIKKFIAQVVPALKTETATFQDAFKMLDGNQPQVKDPIKIDQLKINNDLDLNKLMQNTLSTQDVLQSSFADLNANLNQILNTLKMSAQYDRESSAAMYEQLGKIKDVNGDLVRMQK